MLNNRVVFYSNGIADFQRVFEVKKDESRSVSIPIKKTHIADVLASFNVYGNVTLVSPPTFQPENEYEGNISIGPGNVLENVATRLSGSQVRLELNDQTIEGKLVGVHKQKQFQAKQAIEETSIVVMSDSGLQQARLSDVTAFQFTEEDVQNEINKALQRNFQQIKPDSTFVEFGLSTEDLESSAIVQYTIPVPAWKISYRIRLGENGQAEFQGFAIVDNNSDEDWNNYQVSVVTGDPITFSTDLAESKTPNRRHVNLVSDYAQGHVEIEDAVMLAAPAGGAPMVAQSVMPQARMRNLSKTRGGGVESLPTADNDVMEVEEIGDFCVFESANAIDIPANRSTVIPVFNETCDEVKPVLHYAKENHEERPFRSLDFTNLTKFSLGRGVCTFFESGAYSGSCVIPAMKPEQNRLLAYALDSGVTVNRKSKRNRDTKIGLIISDGICQTKTQRVRETHYLIKNHHDQEFKFYLDHIPTYKDSKRDVQLVDDSNQDLTVESVSETKSGIRATFELASGANVTIKVIEQRIESEKIILVNEKKKDSDPETDWLIANIVESNLPLPKNKEIDQVVELQSQLREVLDQITQLAGETNRLAEKQNRLRKNIKSAGQDELSSTWLQELHDAERQIQEIDDKQLPILRKKQSEMRQQICEAIKAISLEWTRS